MLEEILSRAKKVAARAEVFQARSLVTPVQFEADRLKHIQTKEATATALRLIKGGRIGFAQADGSIEPETLVNMALETCEFGMPAKFDFPGPKTYPSVDVFDPQVDKVTVTEMVGLGEQLIAAVKQHSPDVLCEAAVNKGTATIRIVNSEGGEATYTKSFFTIGVDGVRIQDGDMLFVGDSRSSCHPVMDFKPVAQELITQLERAKRNASISTRVMPVIFTPYGVASALIAPLISAFNGKVVLDGASPLKDKLGQHLFDKRFSLYDDATLAYQTGSSPCDDEGIPTRRTPLVKNGTIIQFLYDLQTAALANAESTGNGNRHGGLPTPSPHSLIIENGDTPFQDMIKDMTEGLIVEQLMGAEQGNILSGDFSGNVLLGYKIEGGEIAGRVKDTMVAGNVYLILKELQAIGNDTRCVGGFLHTPSLYCPTLSVATKTR